MPKSIRYINIRNWAHKDSPNEIIIGTESNVEIQIEENPESKTVTLTLPFGNKFDVVNGRIIIHSK